MFSSKFEVRNWMGTLWLLLSRNLLACRSDRQLYSEGCADAGSALERKCSFVLLHDAPGNGETKAGSNAFGLGCKEGLEDSFLDTFGNPRTIVVKLDTDFAILGFVHGTAAHRAVFLVL